MIQNHQDDEFVAVRVQDPRIQNEGSWNSFVDYKIFLHTNSKAFTAKTSCVRRRYSEFVWLKRKLQKNAGLVPVPDLPGKSFFSFSNEDFLERRRQGLQVFLDKVVNMTVCLSDSQLHLFLQTQLPIGHIQDCVQGHTPFTVTDAILTYASSNRGYAQAQEDDPMKETEKSLTISYESMDSPVPHQQLSKSTFSPDLFACEDPDPLAGLLTHPDKDTTELQRMKTPQVQVLQTSTHLEAVVENSSPVEFFLGDQDLSRETQQSGQQIQTPVEVHSPAGLEEDTDLMKQVDLGECAHSTEVGCDATVKDSIPSLDPGARLGTDEDGPNSDSQDACGHSPTSSNGSIIKVSEEESLVDESESCLRRSSQDNGVDWSEVDSSSSSRILPLQLNSGPTEEDTKDLSNSLDFTFADDNCDFRVLRSSSAAESAELNCGEEAQEVEVMA